MALYSETKTGLTVESGRTGAVTWLRSLFRARPKPDSGIAHLSERDLLDLGIRHKSTSDRLVAELRDIDRLGLGWRRIDHR